MQLIRQASLLLVILLVIPLAGCGATLHERSSERTPDITAPGSSTQAEARREGLPGEPATRRIRRTAPEELAETAPGIALPYSLELIYGVFYDCRPGGRLHRGLDLGGAGPEHGLGTPVRAMARSRIAFIGTPESDPDSFGRRDRRGGYTERRGVRLPRSRPVSGYGDVYFFTRDYGSWHAGVTLIMEPLESEIAGYRLRYMHMADVHPELRVGDIVEAGQEVGLMGGTAVQRDLPHLHIDLEDEDGRRVDIAPLLGLEADTRRRCR